MPDTVTDKTQRATMPTAGLGRNGPFVSRLALGTMTFGAEIDEAEAHRQLDVFVDQGGTLIDTADVYSAGVSEEMIGRWGKNRGGLGDVIIATKGRFAPPPGSHGASRRALVRSVEASLRRLQVEAIDLYFVHGWDRHTDVAETLDTLGDLVRAGKLHHIGWSNVAGWQLQKIVSTAEAHRLPRPVALQPQYSLLDRGIEYEVLPCALENGIGLTPWSPLGGGWLTGKYTADARPEGATRLGENPDRGVEAYDLRNTPRTHAVLDVLRSIAGRLGRPMAHVALAWLWARPGVASVLLGARTADQLAANLGAADLMLDTTDVEALTQASAIGVPPYPYGFLGDWSGLDVWRRLGT
ncbi:aldo/keto reductase [Meridianimarinicoccus sp. RP-17]|uniref:aldo/keto reductase n=1 Tax=Meridianimarinicoccus zhengii TaxID=2056810 RepID=UPI001C9B279C|nr:aldo/keto reductase [Phycocomes zhengii]